MQNWLLQIYCRKLYDDLAKFLSAEKKNCRIASIENYANCKQVQAVSFSWAGEKYSLPVLTLNKEFQIITEEQEKKSFFTNSEPVDIVISLFNLHLLSQKEQIDFIQKMQKIASRAVFLEYENPERNLAYAGYFSFIAWQYFLCIAEKLFCSKNNSFSCFHEYLKSGAVEGILYALPQILPNHSVKILSRRHFGLGAIGMAYLEW